MSGSDSRAPIRTVKKVQFGILSPDEIVRECVLLIFDYFINFFSSYLFSDECRSLMGEFNFPKQWRVDVQNWEV
jgi:hypothetical protein